MGKRLTERQFTFTLTEADENFEPKENSLTVQVTNDAEGKFAFNLLVSDEGTYYYIIEEDIPANKGNIVYDSTVYYVTVTVEKGEDNALVVTEMTITKANGAAVENIEFVNRYKPDPEPEKPSDPEDREEDKNPSTGAAIE